MGDLNKILIKTLTDITAKTEKLIKELEVPELTAMLKEWATIEETINSTERTLNIAKDTLRSSDMFEDL